MALSFNHVILFHSCNLSITVRAAIKFTSERRISISEWNKLDPEIRLAPSVAVFKTKLPSQIRPPPKSIFGIHGPIGLSYHSQIRVGLSKLDFHKFKHNFRDTINPMCPTNDGIEDTEQFFCFALHLLLNDEIFSLEFRNYYDPVLKSIVYRESLFCNFYCMVIKISLMTLTKLYSN